MKNVIWVALAAIVIAAAYFVFVKPRMDGDTASLVESPVVETPIEAPEPSAAIEEPAPVDEAVEEVQDAAEHAAKNVQEAVEDAAEAAQDAVEAVVEDAAGAAEKAVEGVTNAAEQAVKDAVQSAAEAAADVDGAVDPATETTEEAGELTDPAELFTVDGFVLDKALDYVDASDLDAVTKMVTKTAIEKAKDNPELLKAALQAARAKLGL